MGGPDVPNFPLGVRPLELRACTGAGRPRFLRERESERARRSHRVLQLADQLVGPKRLGENVFAGWDPWFLSVARVASDEQQPDLGSPLLETLRQLQLAARRHDDVGDYDVDFLSTRSVAAAAVVDR